MILSAFPWEERQAVLESMLRPRLHALEVEAAERTCFAFANRIAWLEDESDMRVKQMKQGQTCEKHVYHDSILFKSSIFSNKCSRVLSILGHGQRLPASQWITMVYFPSMMMPYVILMYCR